MSDDKREKDIKRWRDGIVRIIGNGKIQYFDKRLIKELHAEFGKFLEDPDPCGQCMNRDCEYRHIFTYDNGRKTTFRDACDAKQEWLKR